MAIAKHRKPSSRPPVRHTEKTISTPFDGKTAGQQRITAAERRERHIYFSKLFNV